MGPREDNAGHGLRNAGDDAFQLTVDYLKQETIEPLRGLGTIPVHGHRRVLLPRRSGSC